MQYDNRQLVIPEYKDDEASDDNGMVQDPQFPFDSPNMRYDKRVHQYYLTTDALSGHGIVVDESEVAVFVRNVSNAVYSYIKVKAGNTNYPTMMYRIAKGWCPHMSPISARAMFMELLLTQARYMTDNGGYAKDSPKVVVSEMGRTKAIDMSSSDGYWLHDDVITQLEALNLTNTQYIRRGYLVDWSQY
ncbi:MAG: hypothetical protein LBK70_00370 [Clostridiales bacterium]|jgi:hypothetical protein|nr:hypothetical protein [Clostridiales bacterium]